MNAVKKFCPLTETYCYSKECGWYNDVTGECAAVTISHKLRGIADSLSPKKTVKTAKEKAE